MSSVVPEVAAPQVTALDPTKHVNYTLGMVLGVDDFTQEFAYLTGRDQWLARELLGYGTVCGLRVSIETDSDGPRVVVAPGTAVSPQGQIMRVQPAQCAYLNRWLLNRRQDLINRLGSPLTGTVTLYLVLCYRACPTDQLPVPGEPCRSEEETMAASRLADDFQLELRFDPPDQREEDAIRDFVAWLSQVEITDEPGDFVVLADFLAAIRAGAHPITSPPASPPDFMFGSPPAAMRIHPAQACLYLDAAFRLWVTELRPLWLGAGETGAGDPPNEQCVLLAALHVPIDVQGQVADTGTVTVDETRRPYLIHLRMLQEWLLCGSRVSGGGGGGGVGVSPSFTVAAETNFGQPPNPGSDPTFSRGNHTHGTPPPPESGTPSPTVVEEIAFGQLPEPGRAPTFSRGDHTHGTPRAPAGGAPSPTVVEEIAFGQTAAAGEDTTFSRGDHTHGTGNFVNYDLGVLSYSIIAAGWVSQVGPPHPPVYGGLSVVSVTPDPDPETRDFIALITFDRYGLPGATTQFIIKALPVLFLDDGNPVFFQVNFAGFDIGGFNLRLRAVDGLIPLNQAQLLEFMIEVSLFQVEG